MGADGKERYGVDVVERGEREEDEGDTGGAMGE